MQLYAVRYETRDSLGRIVEEIDSVWLSRDAAHARKAEINSDPARYPNMVAFVFRYVIRPRTRGSEPRAVPQTSKPGKPRKLTAETVTAIRQRFDDGESARLIASEYGVSFQTVYDIINRKIWAHV